MACLRKRNVSKIKHDDRSGGSGESKMIIRFGVADDPTMERTRCIRHGSQGIVRRPSKFRFSSHLLSSLRHSEMFAISFRDLRI